MMTKQRIDSQFSGPDPQRSTTEPEKNRGMVTSLLTVTLLVGLVLPLHGQQSPSQPPSSAHPFQIQIDPPAPTSPGVPEPVDQPPGEQVEPKDPYWRETVEKAVEQFQSENPERRRSAVMLLGKYPVAPAQEVVARALEDPDAGVRQTALVSVLEEQGQISPAFTEKLMRLVADPNVSIRRIASNSLPMILNGFPFVLQPGAAQMHRQLEENTTRILQDAFRDQDVFVRRNMVNSYPLLRIDLPEETIIALLHDDDAEVAVQTVRWGLPLLKPVSLAREIDDLVRNENPIFRLEVARALQSQSSPDALEALEALQDDPSADVALEAMLAMFYHRQQLGLYERMVKLYRESGGAGDAGQRIIFAAQMLGDRGEPFLREWLMDSNPAHRQQAAQLYLTRFAQQAKMGFLLSLLEDSSQGIRQQAVRALMQVNDRLTAEHVQRTMASRHVDVRRSAAGLARFLPSDQAEEILLDLLLDDTHDVQLAALQQIGQRQMEGWEEIMSISLRVDDPIISRTALDWLMRNPTPVSLELIRIFHDENPQSALRPQIELHLKRHLPSDPS